ncbi:MAG: tachylectin-related carbohydrate-binding protein [Acidimicrobiales bacterium]
MLAAIIIVVLSAGVLSSLRDSSPVADRGVWLARWVKDEVVRVNLAGRVIARLRNPGGAGHPVRVVQEDGNVYVFDPVTNQLKVLDVDRLSVSRSALFSGQKLEVVTGNDQTYVFDAMTGRIQPINATTLANTRPAIDVGSAITGSVDKDGWLWVAESATGEVTPIVDGLPQGPVKVADPGAQLSLTVVGDTVVVVDAASGDLVALDRHSHDVRSRTKIPDAGGRRIALQAGADEGSSVWAAFGDGALAAVDLATGRLDISEVARPGHRLGSPEVTGDQVVVADETAGDVLVIELASRGAHPDPPHVADDGQTIEIIAEDDNVWVNVPEADNSFQLDDDGQATPIFDDLTVSEPMETPISPTTPSTTETSGTTQGTAPLPSTAPLTTTDTIIPPPASPTSVPVGPLAGVMYRIDSGGNLFWYRHDHPADGRGGFANSGKGQHIGTGWNGYTRVFSGGGGVIYAINSDGNMFWYRHLDPSGGARGFASGKGQHIGTGWSAAQVFGPPG